ncbi:MAG: diacylglycerol/lipid kinase family protein [Solirubrobacteraceae bacterium]
MKVCLVVNPSAGGGRAGHALQGVQGELERLGIEHRVEQTRSLEHAGELAIAARGVGEITAALGGDGLISAVAGALKHSSGVLGVLPGGRGNDFARVLGIPLDPVAACSVIAANIVRELDLGVIGDRTFISIASCGFDSDANRIANETRLVRGNLVYAYGALRALAGWRPASFEVTLDGGEPRTVRGYTVAVANSGAYGGGMLMAPSASLQDGMLDVVMVGHVPKLQFLRLLPTVFKGEHVRQRSVQVSRAREVVVAADRPFTMYADGDPIAELPVTIRVLPGAVKVIVPQ